MKIPNQGRQATGAQPISKVQRQQLSFQPKQMEVSMLLITLYLSFLMSMFALMGIINA